MTDMAELLTVVDHFDITGRGLVLLPDFDPPKNGKWKNFSDTVVILTPAGERLELQAEFTLTHFIIRDSSVDVSKRWRINITLPSCTKQAVPLGSKLLCRADVRSTLLETA